MKQSEKIWRIKFKVQETIPPIYFAFAYKHVYRVVEYFRTDL